MKMKRVIVQGLRKSWKSLTACNSASPPSNRSFAFISSFFLQVAPLPPTTCPTLNVDIFPVFVFGLREILSDALKILQFRFAKSSIQHRVHVFILYGPFCPPSRQPFHVIHTAHMAIVLCTANSAISHVIRKY